MQAWFVRGVNDMYLDAGQPVPSAAPGWVTVRVLVAQPSVAEAVAHLTGRWRHTERVDRLWRDGPVRLFGHEFCGEVTDVGEGVEGLARSDRVACVEPATAHGQVGLDLPGAFAQYVSVPVESLVRMPEAVSDTDAATIQPACYAASTAMAARDLAGAVAIVFGQGAIGLPLTQLAKAEGASRVIVVARRPAAKAAARAAGADVVLDSSAEGFGEELAQLADAGIDIAFDAASGPPVAGLSGTTTLGWALESVRPGGQVVVGSALLREEFDFQVMQRKGLSMAFPMPHVTEDVAQRVIRLMGVGALGGGLRGPLLEGIESVPRALEMAAAKREHGIVMTPQVRIWGAA